jgi:hypothetical protein
MANDKPYEIKVQAIKDYQPESWHSCVFEEQGDEFVKMTYMKNKVKTHVRRLEGNRYEVLKTGEIKEYNPMTEAAKKLAKKAALNRTFNDLRGIIRTNFVSTDRHGAHQQVMITLTYREFVFDTKRLEQDFKKFIMRLEYANKQNEFNAVYDFAYIAVFEPHGSGAWHVHLLLKHCGRGALWIDKEVVTRIWGHGMTLIERLRASDAGAYYAAYFTSLLDGAFNEDEEDGGETPHTGEELLDFERNSADFVTFNGLARSPRKAMEAARKKGARLHYYPKHFKLYTCSRNVKRPVKDNGYVFEYDEDERYEEVHSNAYEVTKIHDNGDTEQLNEICHRTYRKKSKP